MSRKLLSAVVVSCLFLGVACAKRKGANNLTHAEPKNPASVNADPKTGSLPVDKARALVQSLRQDSGFSSGLIDKDIEFSEVCFQYVTIGNAGDADPKKYLEISNEACPNDGVVADKDVKLRLLVEQHPTYFTQFIIKDEAGGFNMGIFRKLTNNGVVEYTMEGLCGIDPKDWDDSLFFKLNCDINGADGRFGDPAIWVN
ncbi:MAG: hypothetical protein HYZ71_15955 [Deltaproteobacteria bacterium]|nr:hypothetical protein [Deltaproteobacteria bacterium]